MHEPPLEVLETLKMFLREDIRSGDVTVDALEDMDVPGVGVIYAKGRTMVAGVEEVAAIGKIMSLIGEPVVNDGAWASQGDAVFRLSGPVGRLLSVERVALNIMMRMSGIATKTYRMLEKARAANPKIILAATRKTTPGFRYFEKRAVTIGGGDPHRYSLDDMILIKNNHIAVVGSVREAVRMARSHASFSKKLSCEVRSLEEAVDAIEAGADSILLDNFTPKTLKDVVRSLSDKRLRNRVMLEVSGGVNESNIAQYAESGIDIISSGALTHSYESSDFNMLISVS